MSIKAALLDERGVYLRMDELEDRSELTDRHLPSITACDLPAGRYVWIKDDRLRRDGTLINIYGGAFWEIAWLKRVTATREAALEEARRRNVKLDNPPPEMAALIDFMQAKGL